MRGHCSVVSFVRHKRVYQNYHFKVAVEGVSKCDFAMSRDVACRVSMFATTYKTFNINNLSNQIVETQNFASLRHIEMIILIHPLQSGLINCLILSIL